MKRLRLGIACMMIMGMLLGANMSVCAASCESEPSGHTPGGEVQKADFIECNGGFKKDYYICTECGNPVDAQGNVVDLEAPTKKHTPGTELYPANYTKCGGGFKEDFYLCTVCNWGCDKDGVRYLLYPGDEQHTIVKKPAQAATTEAEGNLEYWYCEVCGNAYEDAEGKKYIEDISKYIIPKLEKTTSEQSVTTSPKTGDTMQGTTITVLMLGMVLSLSVIVTGCLKVRGNKEC